jgi:hypothetical protein
MSFLTIFVTKDIFCHEQPEYSASEPTALKAKSPSLEVSGTIEDSCGSRIYGCYHTIIRQLVLRTHVGSLRPDASDLYPDYKTVVNASKT